MNIYYLYLFLFTITLHITDSLHKCSAYPIPIPGELGRRIVNGFLMPDILVSAVVAVRRVKGATYTNCGGTIISPNHILTAAHCVTQDDNTEMPSRNITIGYGNKDENLQKKAKVSKVTLHPEYFSSKRDGKVDIAVLELDTAILLGQESGTDKLAIYTGEIQSGQDLLAMGWGRTEDGAKNQNILRGVFVKTGEIQLCRQFMKDFEDNNGPQICKPGALDPYKSTCQGDSGTGIVISVDGRIMLAGLDSIAVNVGGDNECGNPKGAHFYVHVAYYMDFIMQATGLDRAYLVGSIFDPLE